MKDELFKEPQSSAFAFTPAVAGVFDDMITRSVPYYKEIVDFSTSIAAEYLQENDIVYDLGSATGATLFTLARKCNKNLELIGIDNAPAMLEKAKQKADFFGIKADFLEADIIDFEFKKCNAIFANFTLQFIRPPNRLELITKLCSALNSGGIFLFAEKIISTDLKLSKILINTHHEFKKAQGYSELEIMQKREALENVLVPYTASENEDMAINGGFSYVEIIFRYGNFALFIAVK
ncbi:MAG: carboxy-S-adenosyl-L-methionine synthase CmoA [Pseudomonadota bacterium]|jgi:tRNA (cmo5U34)-methyltransferase